MAYDLKTVLYLIENSFRIYIILRFFMLFFGRSKYPAIIVALGFSLYFVVNSILFLMLDNPLLTLLSNIVLIFLMSFLFEGKLVKQAAVSFLICAIAVISEDIVYRCIAQSKVVNILAVGILASNLMQLSIELILEKILNLRTEEGVRVDEWMCTLAVPAVSIFIAAVVFDKHEAGSTLVLGTAGLLFLNILIFYLLDHIVQAHQSEYELTLQRRLNEAYELEFQLLKTSEEKIAIIRHDIKNHLFVIENLAQLNKNREITNYISHLISMTQIPEQFVNSKNAAIDSIINAKLYEAKLLNVEAEVSVIIPEELSVVAVDLGCIIGNLLDNSIYALKDSKRKFLKVKVELIKGMLFIDVYNTFEGKLIEKNGRLQTTKIDNKNHGVGFLSIERILKRYQGDMEIGHDDGIFKVKISMFV